MHGIRNFAPLGATTLLLALASCGSPSAAPGPASPTAPASSNASQTNASANASAEPEPEPEPGVVEEPAPSSARAPIGSSSAADAAKRWIRAIFSDDLPAALQASGLPFSWDRSDLFTTRDAMARAFRDAMDDKDHSSLTLGTGEVVQLDASDLARAYRGPDAVEAVRFEFKGESVLIFVRKSDQLVVGMSD